MDHETYLEAIRKNNSQKGPSSIQGTHRAGFKEKVSEDRDC